MDLSADPDLQESKSSLFLRLLDGTPRAGDREGIAKWSLSKTEQKFHLDRMKETDKAIEVLMKAKTIAPQLLKKLEAEIMQKVAERNGWKVALLKAVVSSNFKEIEQFEQKEQKLKSKAEEREAEIGLLRRTAEEDKLHLQEAHRRECDVIRWRAERAERLRSSLSEEVIKALRDKLSKSIQLEEELLETRPRLEESTRLAKSGLDEERNHSVELESNAEPEHGRDIIQTQMDLEMQQVGRKRLRDGDCQPPGVLDSLFQGSSGNSAAVVAPLGGRVVPCPIPSGGRLVPCPIPSRRNNLAIYCDPGALMRTSKPRRTRASRRYEESLLLQEEQRRRGQC